VQEGKENRFIYLLEFDLVKRYYKINNLCGREDLETNNVFDTNQFTRVANFDYKFNRHAGRIFEK